MVLLLMFGALVVSLTALLALRSLIALTVAYMTYRAALVEGTPQPIQTVARR